MNGHDVVWTQPPAIAGLPVRPLQSPRATLEAPAILRFTNDSFMEEFLALLETAPARIADYRVRRETWRGFVADPVVEPPRAPSLVLQRLGITRRSAPGVALAVAPVATPVGTPLKLFQPGQQRHYLVASSLVCRVAGLPDRGVDPGRGERTGYVLRRLLPPTNQPTAPIETWEEHAWMAGERGFFWQRVGAVSERLVPGEEKLPLFAVHFPENDRRRRLFAGVVPVGKREAYLGAPRSSGSATPGITPRTARKILFRKDVVEPWKVLVRRARDVQDSLLGELINGVRVFVGEDREPSADEKALRLKNEREHIQTVSWLILLDFAKYLALYLKPVWRAVIQPSRRPQTGPEQDLFDALESTTLPDALRDALGIDEMSDAGEIYTPENIPATLREALARFGSGDEGLNVNLERVLETVDEPYLRHDEARRARWPDFLFPLADPDLTIPAPLPPARSATLTPDEQSEVTRHENAQPDDSLERIDRLTVLVLRALRDDDPERPPEPAVPGAAVQPANALEGWFVIRCVFERPACEPLHGDVVSDPTERFQLAGFFDPDAPARPIRIGLPIDTTPAGLRKFDKNTALVISDTLCGQLRRIRGITLADLVLSVLPWPFHKPLPSLSYDGPCKTDTGSLGMVCSLSIPIVTICALVLLIIMVSLFDFIFRWLPHFFVCFPIPGLGAKSQAPRPPFPPFPPFL